MPKQCSLPIDQHLDAGCKFFKVVCHSQILTVRSAEFLNSDI